MARMYQDEEGKKYNLPILRLQEHKQSHRFSYKVLAQFRMIRDGSSFRLSMGVAGCWFNGLGKELMPLMFELI